MITNRRMRRSDVPGTVGSTLVLNTGSSVRRLQLAQAVKTFRAKEAQRTRRSVSPPHDGSAKGGNAPAAAPRPPPPAPPSAQAAPDGPSFESRPATSGASPAAVSNPLTASCTSEQHHWVYGTALCDIVAEEGEGGEVLLAKGARGLFVYPMVPDDHDDTVRMRLKKVDPANAKLSYRWVAVYNGDTAEPCVSHFGFLP